MGLTAVGRGEQGCHQDSPGFSWMWPLPFTCAILLLSTGPGGSEQTRPGLSATAQREEPSAASTVTLPTVKREPQVCLPPGTPGAILAPGSRRVLTGEDQGH